MNDVEAEALHLELLQSLPGDGDAKAALSATVEVHRPIRDGRRAACRNCVTWTEEQHDWPCETVVTINQWAHVDAIMAAWQRYLDS